MEKAEFIFFLIALNPIVQGYLIGSIPFGLLLTKIFTKQDIRQIGSGNIGATNVLRTGNKFLAFLTLLLDVAKGAALIVVVYFYQGTVAFASMPVMLAGCGAILGHCFPVWLKFKGGKGVATSFGVLFAGVPYTALVAGGAWLLLIFTTRISSLAALGASATVPFVTFYFYGQAPSLITLLIAALVIWRHKDNIKRLMAGAEPKIGTRKEKD